MRHLPCRESLLPFISFSKEVGRRKQKIPSTCPLTSTTESFYHSQLLSQHLAGYNHTIQPLHLSGKIIYLNIALTRQNRPSRGLYQDSVASADHQDISRHSCPSSPPWATYSTANKNAVYEQHQCQTYFVQVTLSCYLVISWASASRASQEILSEGQGKLFSFPWIFSEYNKWDTIINEKSNLLSLQTHPFIDLYTSGLFFLLQQLFFPPIINVQ